MHLWIFVVIVIRSIPPNKPPPLVDFGCETRGAYFKSLTISHILDLRLLRNNGGWLQGGFVARNTCTGTIIVIFNRTVLDNKCVCIKYSTIFFKTNTAFMDDLNKIGRNFVYDTFDYLMMFNFFFVVNVISMHVKQRWHDIFFSRGHSNFIKKKSDTLSGLSRRDSVNLVIIGWVECS